MLPTEIILIILQYRREILFEESQEKLKNRFEEEKAFVWALYKTHCRHAAWFVDAPINTKKRFELIAEEYKSFRWSII